MTKTSKTPTWGYEITKPRLTARRRRFRRPVTLRRYEHTLPGLGDRRRMSRRRFQADVLIEPFELSLPRCLTTTEDISRRGMFISAPHQYPLRTLLRLRLVTEYGELVLDGRVVHRIEGVGFGCEFIDLTEQQRVALNFLVSMSRELVEVITQ